MAKGGFKAGPKIKGSKKLGGIKSPMGGNAVFTGKK